jgi:hypothetical protein
MRLSNLAARDDRAQKRMMDAADQLAKIKGLDAPDFRIQARDPAVRAMRQREAVADFLEALLLIEMKAKVKRNRKTPAKTKAA